MTAGAARARLRGHRQPGELRVGRPPRRCRGGELAARLARAGVLVAAGDALGEPHHVRIAIYSAAATDRLLQRRRAKRCEASASQLEPAWRSSAPVVPSRILRQALTGLVLLVEVLDHLAHALGRDLEAVALGDLLVARRIRPRAAWSPTRSRGARSRRARRSSSSRSGTSARRRAPARSARCPRPGSAPPSPSPVRAGAGGRRA